MPPAFAWDPTLSRIPLANRRLSRLGKITLPPSERGKSWLLLAPQAGGGSSAPPGPPRLARRRKRFTRSPVRNNGCVLASNSQNRAAYAALFGFLCLVSCFYGWRGVFRLRWRVPIRPGRAGSPQAAGVGWRTQDCGPVGFNAVEGRDSLGPFRHPKMNRSSCPYGSLRTELRSDLMMYGQTPPTTFQAMTPSDPTYFPQSSQFAF